MIVSWALAAALATARDAPPPPVPAIPDRFVGEWNEDPEHCGTGIGHGGLTIGADRIAYYESGGAVRAVVVEGGRELALIASMSGEGLDWLGLLHFRLSPDHEQLIDLAAHGGPVVRHRCPAAGAAGSAPPSPQDAPPGHGPVPRFL